MQITRGVTRRPLRVVVYGPEGIGKTTFASRFPAPVFIDTENSTEFLDVARYPKPSSWTMLLEEIRDAKAQAGAYQTLVLDTADWAETLCKSHICAKKQVSGIEDFGYGKGYVYLAEAWGEMLNLLTEVRDAGLNVVVTAHAALRKFEQPDEMGSYDRYELKLEKKTAPLMKEWADMMLFANYETYVVETADHKKKAQGGRRVMYTSHHPCWDAKNRQGLPEKLAFDFAEIAGVVPGAEAGSREEADGRAQRPAPTKAEGKASAAAETSSGLTATFPRGEDDERAAEAGKSDVPQALLDMMNEKHVTDEEVRGVIAAKGYFPADTPWSVMQEQGFVDGWVIPWFDRIVDAIESNPDRLPF